MNNMAAPTEDLEAKGTKRGKHWQEREQIALAGTFFEEAMQRMFDGTSRNSQACRAISDKPEKEAINSGPKECKTKMNILKTWFKKQTDRVRRPGAKGESRQKRPDMFRLLNEHRRDRSATRPITCVKSATGAVDETPTGYDSMESRKTSFTKPGTRGKSRLVRAPDGDWGWFVLLAAHSTLLFREGIAKCLGVFLPTFKDYFNCTTSLIGWISSLCVTFADFTGLVSGPLCQKLGCRPVAMIGGILGGTGLACGAIVVNMLQLSWCLALAGIGLGLALTPSLTMVSRYFDKRYTLANGLAYSGSGVGILVLAPLSQILITHYGWRGALFIIGGLCFNVTVSGALLRPLVSSVPRQEKKRPNGKHYQPLLPNGTDHDDSDSVYRNGNLDYMEAQETKSIRSCCNSCTCISTDSLGLSLFKEVPFVTLMLVQFCGRFTYMGWLIYLVPHAIEKGVAPLDAAFLASVAGVTNIIARATHGIFVDRKWLTSLQLLTMSAILATISLLLDPLLVTYWTLMASSLAYGLASGVFFPIAVVVIKDAVGIERFPNALGWSYGFAGIGRMTAGFLTGWLYDIFGNYNISFLTLGFVQAVSVLLIAINCLIQRRRRIK